MSMEIVKSLEDLASKVELLEKVITRVGDTSNTTRQELYVVLKKLEWIENHLKEVDGAIQELIITK